MLKSTSSPPAALWTEGKPVLERSAPGRAVRSMTIGESEEQGDMNEGPAARPHRESTPSNSSSCATSSVAASPSGNCSFSAFFFPFAASVNCSQSRLWRRKEPFSTTIQASFLPHWPRRGNLRPLFIVSSLSTSQRSRGSTLRNSSPTQQL